MKGIAAPALLAMVGLMLAGCASGHKRESKATANTTSLVVYGGRAITITGSAVIPHVKAGTRIRCKGGPTIKIPAGASRVSSASAGVWSQGGSHGPAPSTNLQLSRSANGTVTASCTR
jgi:hypothetical protein